MGCFPCVLGPVSTTLPHFLLENEGVLKILELELGTFPIVLLRRNRSGKFGFPRFVMCIICLIFSEDRIS